MTARTTIYLIITLLLSGCTSSPIDRPDSKLDISRIRIDPIGRQADGSADAVSRCSGFILSEREVRTFLVHAARFRDDGSEKYTRILPCSAGGSAVINGRKYRWVIRTGGVGELVSGADRFITICGKGCCDKVPGIC